MGFLKAMGTILGTILAILVMVVLGIIGWFLFQIMGFAATGLLIIGLIWYAFAGEKPDKPTS